MKSVNKNSVANKLSINADKTQIMELDKWRENTNIVVDNLNVVEFRVFNMGTQCLAQMETVRPT